jgi:ABC-2 type transport system permease protein
MNALVSALHVAVKDLRRSFRSTFALGMMLAVPLLITGLIYFAFGGLRTGAGTYDLPTLRVALVNLDRPANGLDLGGGLVEMFRDERIPRWIALAESPDESSARAALARREIDVAVVIPADLSARATSPDGAATVTLLHDPTLTIGPAIVRDIVGLYLDGVQGTRIALNIGESGQTRAAVAERYGAWYADFQRELRHGADPLLAVQAPAAGAESGGGIAALMGTVMAGMLVFFVFFTAANGAQSLLREDEEGTLARLFTTPMPRVAILGGKYLAVFATVAVQTLVLLLVSSLAFGIDWGRPLTVALAALGLTVAATGFGLLLTSFIKTSRQAGPITGGALAATGMLGGLFTTTADMPAGFAALSRALPQGWGLAGWKLALGGAGASDALLPFAVLLAMGAGCFAVGATVFNRRFA